MSYVLMISGQNSDLKNHDKGKLNQKHFIKSIMSKAFKNELKRNDGNLLKCCKFRTKSL